MYVLLSDDSGITGPDKISPPPELIKSLATQLHTLPEASEGFSPNRMLKVRDKGQTSQTGSVELMARMRSFPGLEAHFTNTHLGTHLSLLKSSNRSSHPAVIKKGVGYRRQLGIETNFVSMSVTQWFLSFLIFSYLSTI